jgi:cobalt-zinc-cadmium efflux system outer membrane protein
LVVALLTSACAAVGQGQGEEGGETARTPTEYVAQLQPEPLPRPEEELAALTLAEVEGLALAFNPTLAEAAARVRAARGEQLQVGLPPNPTYGYMAGEIGNEGAAGQQGLVVGQEFIRGNKLGLNRAVASREAQRLEQEFAAQERRVLTDVRIAYYEAYLAQRRLELSRNLQAIGERAVDTAGALVEAQEGRRTDLLQAEIEGQRAGAALLQSESNLRGAWRRLTALVGQQDMAERSLTVDLSALRWQSPWNETLVQLMRESPEVAEAEANVDRARAALARACAEPIPDISAQASVQYDDSTSDTIAGAQVTLPLPLWNRNQGGIAKAQADLVAARRRLEGVQRRLQFDLAEQFQRYETALARVDALQGGILGRAQQNLELTVEGYRAGELAFLDFLTVQRTYFQVNLEYLSALGDLNESVQMLHGLLLAGSYNESGR